MAERIRIMPLGDSITAGVHFTGSTRTCEAGGYRTFLWNAIKDDEPRVEFVGSQCDGPKGVSRRHEGHPGWRTAELLEHVEEWMDEARPHAVLLMSGTNDIIRDQDALVARERLAGLVAALHRHTPGLRLGVATIPPLVWSESRCHLEPLVVEYNEEVRCIARESALSGKVVALADVHGAMEEAHLIGTHPSPEGYRRIAEVWRPVVATLRNPRPS